MYHDLDKQTKKHPILLMNNCFSFIYFKQNDFLFCLNFLKFLAKNILGYLSKGFFQLNKNNTLKVSNLLK